MEKMKPFEKWTYPYLYEYLEDNDKFELFEIRRVDEKTYEAALRLGLVTDTQDVTGTVLERREVDITDEQLDAALAGFRGEIEQLPPMYSAVSVNGKRLYELARQNITIERKPRPVTIYSLTIDSFDESSGEGVLRISC
mgnify:CR=1 FL=1